MVLAPEHPLVDRLTTDEQRAAVAAIPRPSRRESPISSAPTWRRKRPASSPARLRSIRSSDERIPIWIADYVLMGYGTGAIMAVPAHDERDFEFARSSSCRLFAVVQAAGKTPEEHPLGYTGDGVAINSPLIDGLADLGSETPNHRLAGRTGRRPKRRFNYKLRDWLFSRQRYWGEPFPIIWREGKHEALAGSRTAARAAAARRFQAHRHRRTAAGQARKIGCAIRRSATRETNTMPQWAGSCWYYLRFCDPQNDERFVGEEAERYWMGGRGHE